MKIELTQKELSIIIEALELYGNNLYLSIPNEAIDLRDELLKIKNEPKP